MAPIDPAPSRTAALIVALAPAALLGAFVAHPFLTVLPDAEAVGTAVQANTTRWAIAHLTTAVASGLVAVAFVAIHERLRAARPTTASSWGLPFVVFGSVLYAFLPGLEFAPLAAVETGGDALAVQAALESWFIPAFATSVLAFAIGVVGFTRSIRASDILTPRATGVVLTALVLMAVARAVPLGIVQFHVQGIAAVVALWPVAWELWRQPATQRTVRSADPMTAT